MSALRDIIAHFGIEVDSKEVDKGKEKLEGFVETLKGIGEKFAAAFALDKLKEFVMGMAESGEALSAQAEVVGMSAQSLQQWRLAADLSGVSAGQLDSAMMRLQRSAGGAGGKGGLGGLGIAAKDAHGNIKPVNQLMEDLAEKIKSTEDPAKRAAILTKALGKTGSKMVGFFKDGAEGIKKFREETKALGGGMSPEFIKRSKELVEETKKLKFAWMSFKSLVAMELMPIFTYVVEWLIKAAVYVGKLSKSTSGMQAIFVMLGVAALIAFSSMIGPIGALLFTLAPLILAFLVIEDFITFLRGGDSVIGRALDLKYGQGTGEKVRKGILETLEAFVGLYDVITGGSSKAAQQWRDDWNFLRTQLPKDFGFLGTVVAWFLGLFVGGWKHMTDQISALWTITTSLLSIMWIHLMGGFKSQIWLVQDAFAGLVNGITAGMRGTMEMLSNAAGLLHMNGIKAQIDGVVAALTLDTKHTEHGQAGIDAKIADNRTAMLNASDRLNVPMAAIAVDRNAKAYQQADNGTGTRDQIVNITVPPGTPHTLAARVGAAAHDGVNRANAAALIPGDAT